MFKKIVNVSQNIKDILTLSLNVKKILTLGQISTKDQSFKNSQDKCPTPLRQMSYTLKTITLNQIVIASSHWTKNFCVFDANTHLK
jgi:hypothetical protein